MTARRRPAKPQREPEPEQISVSPATIKWLLGALAALFAAIVGWNQVATLFDNHWRLEKTQQQQDKLIDAQIAAAKAESAANLEAHRIAEARQLAWLNYSVQDFRAAAAAQWAKQCLFIFKSKEQCHDAPEVAADAKQKASDARRIAEALSKERQP